ncbi:MAG: site-specific integrase [Hyphomicrobium sp.]|uniref:tyrosine-type recombinase/integrase n=1 Tax=Hyphomicrobium sp. TaxID=82 RepID=UPI001320C4BE|nr:tyrosine-type recombinase/integrase [Hyphomicrobium sp.]KAB2943075.1 MAG: tyrosine-type recombinase/integrase [Hyphomicrobium sp.]MBZ0208950.1 site-specific integrase [Hyphomicrobium sp.]
MPRLTDVSIRALPLPPTGQVTYDDENSPLKLRISHGGAKTFIVMLGSGKRHTIGRFGEVSLADAREAARRLRAQKTLRAILPSSRTTDDAVKAYLADIHVRPSTRAYYERHLSRLSGRLSDQTAQRLSDLISKLTPAARNQALASFRAFFAWCISRHDLETNPCQRLSQAKQKSRERTLTDAELKAIWQACENDSFGKIVRMLMLTGQRRSEIAALESAWITLHTDQPLPHSITFPPHITKNGEEHTIPLSPLANSILLVSLSSTQTAEKIQPSTRSAEVPAKGSSPNSALLFPSSKTGGLIRGWNKLKASLDKKSGVTGWTLHDLRRTFSTIHASLGTPPHVTEALLNHKTGTLTPIAKIYNRYRWQKEMREAMEKYDAYIAKVCSAV